MTATHQVSGRNFCVCSGLGSLLAPDESAGASDSHGVCETGRMRIGDDQGIFGDSPLIWALIAAEVLFWAVVVGGLVARYGFRRQRASVIILLGVPVIVIALVVLTGLDLAGGSAPDLSHALAAVYLGFTLAYGPSMIVATDAWFARRYADGPPKAKAPKSGPIAIRRAWISWRRFLVTWLLSLLVLGVMQLIAGGRIPQSWAAAYEAPLPSMAITLTAALLIWLVADPLYLTVFKSRAQQEAGTGQVP